MEKKGSKAKVNRHTWKKVIKEVEGFFFFNLHLKLCFLILERKRNIIQRLLLPMHAPNPQSKYVP